MVKIIQTVYPNGYSNDKTPVVSEMLFEDIQVAWESLLEIFFAYEKIYASDYYDKNGLINPIQIGTPGQLINPITIDNNLVNPIFKVKLFDKDKIGEFKYE